MQIKEKLAMIDSWVSRRLNLMPLIPEEREEWRKTSVFILPE